MELSRKKIVFIGDAIVGKTSLLRAFKAQTNFFNAPDPTVFDILEDEITVDNVQYAVSLCDTSGMNAEDKVRSMIYQEADCFVLCYDLSDRKSFSNVTDKWWREISAFNKPIILTGTKCDLATESNKIWTEVGEELKQQIKAFTFIACSAVDFKNVNEVFFEAIRSIVN